MQNNNYRRLSHFTVHNKLNFYFHEKSDFQISVERISQNQTTLLAKHEKCRRVETTVSDSTEPVPDKRQIIKSRQYNDHIDLNK